MEEGGAKRIVVILAIVAIAALGVFWFWQRSKQRALESGNVYVKNQASDQGQATPALPPPGTAPTAPETPAAQEATSEPPSTPAAKPSAAVQHIPSPAQSAHAVPLPMAQPHGAVAVPAADSIPRNPPNGLIFAGSGKYQLYRQGDITWRLDTDNGRACIIFATDTQWSKTRVWDAGCGAS